MKKTLVLILAGLIALSAAACNNNDDNNSKSENNNSAISSVESKEESKADESSAEESKEEESSEVVAAEKVSDPYEVLTKTWNNFADDEKFTTVLVKDYGIGIPEEELPNLFERFYRVDKSHSTKIGGTGLGLAITRNAILMHRGAIKVESKQESGTTFSVKIPLTYVSK